MVLGFGCRLEVNFNRLMFVDDLIIITNASRSAARNCEFYLDIYCYLTGQKANLVKSTIHVSSRCNSKIISSFKSLQGIKMSSFPFKYLGVLISPKRLTVHQCQYLVDRDANCCKI